jgi:hypothetical protein
MARMSVALLARGDVTTQSLDGEDKLTGEVLQALDLLVVAFADVLEFGLKARDRTGHLGLAGRVAGKWRRRPQEDLQGRTPEPIAQARDAASAGGSRLDLLLGHHRRLLIGIMAQPFRAPGSGLCARGA